MKVSCVTLVLAVSAMVTAHASAESFSQSHLASAHDLVKLLQTTSSPSAKPVTSDACLKRHQGQVVSIMQHLIATPTENQLAERYAAAFTQEELETIKSFYGSEAGRKFIAKMPEISLATARLQQEIAQQNEQQIRQAVTKATANDPICQASVR